MCLVEHDQSSIFQAPIVNDYPQLEQLVQSVRDEVCTVSTNAPSFGPTE